MWKVTYRALDIEKQNNLLEIYEGMLARVKIKFLKQNLGNLSHECHAEASEGDTDYEGEINIGLVARQIHATAHQCTAEENLHLLFGLTDIQVQDAFRDCPPQKKKTLQKILKKFNVRNTKPKEMFFQNQMVKDMFYVEFDGLHDNIKRDMLQWQGMNSHLKTR